MQSQEESATIESTPEDREGAQELLARQEEVQELKRRRDRISQQLSQKFALITASVGGFIESITLSLDTNLLQDILKLLTLWFTHGSNPDVNQVRDLLLLLRKIIARQLQ